MHECMSRKVGRAILEDFSRIEGDYPQKVRKYYKTLRRRLDFLQTQLKGKDKTSLSYTIAEAHALEFVVTAMEKAIADTSSTKICPDE